MAGTTLGTAWIQIKPTMKGVTAELRTELAGVSTEAKNTSSKFKQFFSAAGKEVGNEFKQTFKAAGTVIKTTLVTSATAATGAAIGIVKSALDEFANYEQLVGGVDTLFKESSQTVQGYAKDAYKSAGMSANQYMETVTGFSASLIKSLGGDTAKAAEVANTAITDMADNSNKMGTSMESIQYAYQGFAKQNYTMLDNLKLGYGGTKEEMEKLLADAEKLSGTHYEIGNFADMVEAIHVIQNSMEITGTTAKEASTTISGSVRSMKSAWKNLMTGMAADNLDVGTLIDNFVESFKTAAGNIMPRIMQAIGGMSRLINELAPVIAEQLPGLMQAVLPSLVSAVATLISSLIQNLPTLLSSVGKAVVDALPVLWNAIQMIIPQLLELIGKALQEPKAWEAIGIATALIFAKSLVKGLGGKAMGLLKGGLSKVFSKATSKLSIGGDGAADLSGAANAKSADTTVKEVQSWGQKIAGAIRNIAAPIKQAFASLGEILGSVVGAVMEPIKVLFQQLAETIRVFFTTLADPAIAVGAAMFAAVAASLAAAILLIGSAIGVVMPVLTELFNNILMPIADFIRDTVLLLIDSLTQALGTLTQTVLIPLGEFLVGAFNTSIQTITTAITNLTQQAVIPLINTLAGAFMGILTTVSNMIISVTQNAIIPLINTLSGAFTEVVNTVGALITNVITAALQGVANVIDSVSRGFESLGRAIATALGAVQGILQTFADLINGMAEAIVAVVALVTRQSIDYGRGYAHVGYSLGGRVLGEGSTTSDSIPAMLSKDEYVIKAASAQKIGYDKLDALNETGRLGGGQTNYFTINGYNKSPEELATIISRKIAFNQRGVLG